jgi:chemotaxis signal transduction protein
MRTSKFLVFKINCQQFAVRTNTVLNIIDKKEITDFSVYDYNKPYYKSAFSYKSNLVPIIDLRDILGMKNGITTTNESVLVVEIMINNSPELAGICIDEITEIADFDDFFAYPYIPIKQNSCSDLREGIIIRHNEPVIIINSSKIFASNIINNKAQAMEVFSN